MVLQTSGIQQQYIVEVPGRCLVWALVWTIPALRISITCLYFRLSIDKYTRFTLALGLAQIK